MGFIQGIAAGCRIWPLTPEADFIGWRPRHKGSDYTTVSLQYNTHHNGLPKLLIRAQFRHKDSRSISACPAHLCHRACRSSANRSILNPDRATCANTSPSHHQIKDPTPPFKPECASSASTSQQCHPPARCPLLPPCARRTGMADLQLQLQQGLRQDLADRISDHGSTALSIRCAQTHGRPAEFQNRYRQPKEELGKALRKQGRRKGLRPQGPD